MAGYDVRDRNRTGLASLTPLMDLAVKLGECKSLGRKVGLTDENFGYIEQSLIRIGKKISYRQLLQWRQTYGQQATGRYIANAMHYIGRQDLEASVHRGDQEEVPVLSSCICRQNSYIEIKSHSDGSVVILHCSRCNSEWLPTTDSTTTQLVWKNKKFSFKIPCILDLSKLKHEDVKDVKNLRHGDQIVFRRAPFYDHHAIFLQISENENINVIHWTGPPIEIKRADISFPKGGVRRVQYPESDPANVVVARAYYMKENSSQVYDLANNNCESLATFCKTGRAFSTQGKVIGDVLPFLPRALSRLSS